MINDDEERKRYLHLISLIMPKSHRGTMEVLFAFLKWVASFAHLDSETGSKMDLGNLATVICPSILYSRGQNALRDETFGALRVVTSLLENQDEFFLVPQEFVPLLADSETFANALELPSKDFLKKVDMYMRVKNAAQQGGRGAGPAPSTPFMGAGQLQMQQQQQALVNGSPVPRYPASIPPPLSSPTMERPPPIGGVDRSGRPSPQSTPQPQQQGSTSNSNHGQGQNGNGGGYFGNALANDYQQQHQHQQQQMMPPGSPSLGHHVPQGLLQQQQQRTPPIGGSQEWSPPPPPSRGGGTPSGSRPSSVVGYSSQRQYSGNGQNMNMSTSPMEAPGNHPMYGSPPTNGYHQNPQNRQR